MAPGSRDLVLLYDGRCGLCNGTVRFILARDHGGMMCFAPLQGEFAKEILARHPELRGIDSLVLVERSTGSEPAGERVAVRSAAVLGIARYLGGAWRAALVLRAVPRAARDWGYDAVARVRYRLFGRHDACPIPEPEVRERFLP